MRNLHRPALLLALVFFGTALYPVLHRSREESSLLHRLEHLASAPDTPAALPEPDPALALRVDSPHLLLASWQTIGGCGAGSGGGSSVGLKWIGRSVRGGLFSVQEQVSYSQIGSSQYPEHNFFVNTLITRDIGDKWSVGANVPFVYKYLVDPQHLGGPGVAPVDYSNGGLGDVNLLLTSKLGRINATSLTGMVGLPTGAYDVSYNAGGTPLNQSQQIGFGKFTASLTLDHTFDEVWGLIVVGGVGAWRGGTNSIHNYRAPSGTVYGYTGYFLGPLVPAIGLSITGYTGHDKDQDSIQRTPLLTFAANASIEWSSDWIALLLAASIPYGYDGLTVGTEGQARSPWGFRPWTVSLGVAASPF